MWHCGVDLIVRRLWRPWLMLLLLATCLSAHAQRAIWMWEDDSYRLLEQPEKMPDVIRFLQQKKINKLFLYADAHEGRLLLLNEPQRYAYWIRSLHERGVEVYALLGSWPLHTEQYVLPEQRKTALAMVQRVLDYNLAAAPMDRFDGINIDIEPHVLSQWATQREELLRGFIDLSEAFMALKRRANLKLKVGPAIPFWWDGIPIQRGAQRRPASEYLQDIYDYVALMDYRNQAEGPDGILSHASEELAYARQIGKTVMIGIETSATDLPKLTFHHLGEADLERELGITSRALAGNPAFGGFVLHHYGSYRQWLE